MLGHVVLGFFNSTWLECIKKKEQENQTLLLERERERGQTFNLWQQSATVSQDGQTMQSWLGPVLGITVFCSVIGYLLLSVFNQYIDSKLYITPIYSKL